MDSGNSVQEFLKKNPFNFNILVDGYVYTVNSLKITGFPTNMFLDKNGYVERLEIRCH